MSFDTRKNALLWALGMWFMRRMIRRRAERAVAGLAAGAVARRRSFGAIVGAVLLVGLLVAAFVAWRRLAASPESEPLAPYDSPLPATPPIGEPEGSA